MLLCNLWKTALPHRMYNLVFTLPYVGRHFPLLKFRTWQ